MRYIASVPTFTVYLDGGKQLIDHNTGNVINSIQPTHADFKGGLYETKDENIDKLMINHLGRLKERRMRVMFGIHPGDQVAADALAKELGVTLPPFSIGIGRAFHPHAKGFAQAYPSDVSAAFPTDTKANTYNPRVAILESENRKMAARLAALEGQGEPKVAEPGEVPAEAPIVIPDDLEAPAVPADLMAPRRGRGRPKSLPATVNA